MTQSVVLFVVLLLLGTIQHTSANESTPLEFKDCGSTGGKVLSLTLNLKKAIPGKRLTFHTVFKSYKKVEGGTFYAKASRTLFGQTHTVFVEERKLCEVVVSECPIKKGTNDIEFSVTLPVFTPKGNYHTEITYKDKNDKQFACYSTDLEVVKSTSGTTQLTT